MINEKVKTLKTVLEDLNDLFDEFNTDIFQDSRIRKSSATLNLLLIEGILLRAWRFAVSNITTPYIVAASLNPFIENDPQKTIEMAMAGGAHLNGIFYALPMITKGGKNVEPKDDTNPTALKRKLGQYINDPGLVFEGKSISRSTIIQYLANKQGGKHLDFKRGKSKKEKDYLLLDKYAEYVFDILGKKNAVNLEVHSIIQALAKSEDIKYLMMKIKTELLKFEK